MTKIVNFLYNVITPEKSKDYNFSPDFWSAHPDWRFFVRTNIRYSRNHRIWLGGGGKTLEEALEAAKESVRTDAGPSLSRIDDVFLLGPPKVEVCGEETKQVIKN